MLGANFFVSHFKEADLHKYWKTNLHHIFSSIGVVSFIILKNDAQFLRRLHARLQGAHLSKQYNFYRENKLG